MAEKQGGDDVQAHMGGVRKTRAHLELNLERDVRGNKKSFLKYMNSRRKTKENVPTAVCGKRLGDKVHGRG